MSRRGRSLLWMCWIAFVGCKPSPVANPLDGFAGVGAAPTNAVVSGAGGSQGVVAGAPSAGTAARAPAGDLPCPVAALLEMHCVECHAHHPRLGAPMALIDAASFRELRSGQTVAALVAMRVVSSERPMPPSMLLPASDVAALLEWTKAGAAPAANGCIVHDPFESPDTTGQGGSVAMPPLAGAAAGAAGSAGTGAPPATSGDWRMFGGDLANDRVNADETTINAQNVSTLKALWTFKGAATTSTPAVVDGVVYLPTWDGKVHALDMHTGAERWVTALPDLIDSSPAVSATQIFVADDQASLHALERSKGTVQWSKLVDPHAEAHLWSSPIYIESAGLVIVGVASGEEQTQPPYSFRGSVVALDSKTGAEKWRFYTTTNDSLSGPGIGVWASAAVDEKRKLAIIGTGNAYSGMAGKYADSLLALNYETGQLAWSKQFTTGDVFSIYGGSNGPDADIGATANLFSIGGKDVVGIAIKNGDYAVLDRETGTQIWTKHVGGMGSMGGMIASAAYVNGKIFVASNTWPSSQSVMVAALDAEKGDQLWMQTITGGLAYGGVLYANGVVYVGTTSSALLAYDAMSGKQLWMVKAPDAIAGGVDIAHGMLFVPWGYTWTLREGAAGSGGLTAYGLGK